MDSVRTRTTPKPRCMATQLTSKNDTEDIKYSDEEKQTISDLKQLYLETIKLDVELQRDIYNMEKSYEVKHNGIFEKRKKILDEFRKNHGDGETNAMVQFFWLKVLKASYTELISPKDVKILTHLVDVRCKLFNEPEVNFVIEFHFEPNDYFTNSVLTKTYYLNCLPDPQNPLSYDGAEIFKCEGCAIDWKNPEERETDDATSFFDFFTPPCLPDDPDDEHYCDINSVLQNDFELGFYLKERVIPKAVIFFTGEIADCQSSDESASEIESDEESAEDEDASSNNDK